MPGYLIVGFVIGGLLVFTAITLIVAGLISGEDLGMGSCIGGGMGLVILALSIVGTCVSNQEYSKFMHNIVSIRRNDATGSFVLGTSREDSNSYYCYYYKDDKGYKLGKQRTNECYIIETDEVEPCVYHIKEKGELYSYYKIYVPYDTIITTYVLN